MGCPNAKEKGMHEVSNKAIHKGSEGISYRVSSTGPPGVNEFHDSQPLKPRSGDNTEDMCAVMGTGKSVLHQVEPGVNQSPAMCPEPASKSGETVPPTSTDNSKAENLPFIQPVKKHDVGDVNVPLDEVNKMAQIDRKRAELARKETELERRAEELLEREERVAAMEQRLRHEVEAKLKGALRQEEELKRRRQASETRRRLQEFELKREADSAGRLRVATPAAAPSQNGRRANNTPSNKVRRFLHAVPNTGPSTQTSTYSARKSPQNPTRSLATTALHQGSPPVKPPAARYQAPPLPANPIRITAGTSEERESTSKGERPTAVIKKRPDNTRANQPPKRSVPCPIPRRLCQERVGSTSSNQSLNGSLAAKPNALNTEQRRYLYEASPCAESPCITSIAENVSHSNQDVNTSRNVQPQGQPVPSKVSLENSVSEEVPGVDLKPGSDHILLAVADANESGTNDYLNQSKNDPSVVPVKQSATVDGQMVKREPEPQWQVMRPPLEQSSAWRLVRQVRFVNQMSNVTAM